MPPSIRAAASAFNLVSIMVLHVLSYQDPSGFPVMPGRRPRLTDFPETLPTGLGEDCANQAPSALHASTNRERTGVSATDERSHVPHQGRGILACREKALAVGRES
jgi:hypothetical protein